MPKVEALDRLKSQLLTSGVQQKNQPLYQVINQLIDFLRQAIDTQQLQLDDLQQCCDATKTPSNTISNAPFPYYGDDESNDEVSPVIIPGPPGPRGPAGPSVTGPLFLPEEQEYQEYPPILTLTNGVQLIPGEWTFNNNITRFSNTSPRLVIRDAGGGADSKHWVITVVAGVMYFQPYDDALSASVNALLLVRTGLNIDSIRIQTGAGVLRTIWDTNGVMDHRYGLMLSGQASISLTADQTAWAPTGLGTATYYFSVIGTAPWVIRGISAQSAGTYIVVVNAGANPIDFNHEDGAASAANRILNPGAVNIAITQHGSIHLYYDGVASRWRVISWE